MKIKMITKGIAAAILLSLCHSASFAFFANKYTIVEENNKKGLVNDKGELIIPAQYDDLGWSKGMPMIINNVLGYKVGNLWGLINIKNKKEIAPAYAVVYPANDRLLIASKLNRHNNNMYFGLISTEGETILSFKYYSLAYHEGCLIASYQKDRLSYGVVDLKDRVLAPLRYKRIDPLPGRCFTLLNFENKTAFFNAKTRATSAFEYDSVYAYNDKYLIVVSKGKKGLMDINGQPLVQPRYKAIKVNDDNTVSALPFTEWHILDRTNQTLNTFAFDELHAIGDSVLKVKIGSNEALMKPDGSWITDLSQMNIKNFEGRYAAAFYNGKYGVIDKQGKMIIPPEYDEIVLAENYFLANKATRSKGSWTVVDLYGNPLNGPAYHDIYSITDKLFAVRLNEYWGLIDAAGEKVATCKFDTLIAQHDGNIKASFLNQEGIMNEKGEWVISPQSANLIYLSPDLFVASAPYCKFMIVKNGQMTYCADDKLVKRRRDLLEVRKDGKQGLLTLEGKRLLPARYDAISELQGDSIYTFLKEGRYGIMTKSGRILADDQEYDTLFEMSEGFMAVKISGRYGFVDPNGDLRVANRYDSVRKYSDGFAAIKLLDKWGFINKLERLKVQPNFDHVEEFRNGLAIVEKDGKYGLVNKEGKMVLPATFDQLTRTEHNRFISLKDEKFGLIGREGNELVYPKYDHIEDLRNGHVIIGRKGRYGVATIDGVLTIPIIYQNIKYDRYNDRYLASQDAQWITLSLQQAQRN